MVFKGADSAWCPTSLRLWAQLNVKGISDNTIYLWFGTEQEVLSLKPNQFFWEIMRKKNHIIPQQRSSKNIPEKQLAIENELPTSTSTQAIAAYCNLTQFSAFKIYCSAKYFWLCKCVCQNKRSSQWAGFLKKAVKRTKSE